MDKRYDFSEMSLDDISNFIDNATPREGILLMIYEHVPELFKEKGEKLLLDKPCEKCGERTVYVGPNISIFETGHCGQCGNLHEIY